MLSPFSAITQCQNRRGYLFEWQYELSRTKRDGCARHSKDDTRRLVLGDSACPNVAHGTQTYRAVLSHAGQHDADSARAVTLGHRVEQGIDGWLVAVQTFV
jgi:hypothetical protein